MNQHGDISQKTYWENQTGDINVQNEVFIYVLKLHIKYQAGYGHIPKNTHQMQDGAFLPRRGIKNGTGSAEYGK